MIDFGVDLKYDLLAAAFVGSVSEPTKRTAETPSISLTA
jgi:hypothetical protein